MQERIYQALRERILSGVYEPGDRLVIDSLARDFGVSGIPVREAIRRLEAEGLVVYRPNVGPQVAPQDSRLYEEELEVLAVLEGYATALSAPEMGPQDIERLREINSELLGCMNARDSLGFGRQNHEFHRAIYEHCPNRELINEVRQTSERLEVTHRIAFEEIPHRGWESIREHQQLIRLIASQASFAEIEAAARQHKLCTIEAFRRQRSLTEIDAVALAGEV